MQLFLKAVLHKYPAFLKDLEERHIHYNETLEELASLEKRVAFISSVRAVPSRRR